MDEDFKVRIGDFDYSYNNVKARENQGTENTKSSRCGSWQLFWHIYSDIFPWVSACMFLYQFLISILLKMIELLRKSFGKVLGTFGKVNKIRSKNNFKELFEGMARTQNMESLKWRSLGETKREVLQLNKLLSETNFCANLSRKTRI